MPSGAAVLSAGFWGSPRPCHSANLGINRAGRQMPLLRAVCAACSIDGAIWQVSVGCPEPWVMPAGQDTLVYPSWILHLWLPPCGPNTSQELGLPWSQLCHIHQDRLQSPSCCLLCHKHHALFSILTMCPFYREKPPSHYSWAVLPCRFRRWSV